MNTKFNLFKKLKEKVTNKAPENVSENNFRMKKKNRSKGTKVKLIVFESRDSQCEGTLSEIFKGTCIERAVQIVQSKEEFKNLNVQVRDF